MASSKPASMPKSSRAQRCTRSVPCMSIAHVDDLSGLPTPSQLNACALFPARMKSWPKDGDWCAGEEAQLSHCVHGTLCQERGKMSCPASTQSQIPLLVLGDGDMTVRAGIAPWDVLPCVIPDGRLGQLVQDATFSILHIADHACWTASHSLCEGTR